MMMRMRFGVAAISLAGLLSACMSADTSGPAQASTARASIEDSCINPTEITRQEVLNDQEIRFVLRNGEVWLNHLPRVCPGLRSQQAFSWEVRGTLVCSNEQLIRVKDEGTTCMLGEFARLPSSPG